MRAIVHKPSRTIMVHPGKDKTFEPMLARAGEAKGAGWYALPHTSAVTGTLNAIGVETPHPISLYYDWRGMKPYAHQRIGAEFMASTHRCFNLSDIGTGKTLTAEWAMDYLRQFEGVKKVLIVAPKSTVNHVWVRDLFKNFRDLKVASLLGASAKRRDLLHACPDVAVINHDGIKVLQEELKAYCFDLVIVDESTGFKTHTSDRWKALNEVTAHGCRLWLMTGTPTPQEPTDIFGQAKLVCPQAIPQTFGRARDELMHKVGQFKYVPRKGCEALIHKWIWPYSIRFTLDECIDLPDDMRVVVECDATPQQDKIEKDLRKEAASLLDDGGIITAVNEGVLVSKLLQAACGAVIHQTIDGMQDIREVDCQPKLDQLHRILLASSRPVLVFCPFRAPLKMLAAWCAQNDFKAAVVDGDTKQADREAAFDGIQSGELKVLIANPETMAHGITLTASNVIVWWGLPFKRESYIQANGRIRRIGQERKTYYAHLLSTRIERIIYNRHKDGLALQGALMELLQR